MHKIFKIVLLFYFISHIPITLCLDFQVLFGAHYPAILQEFNAWYVNTYKDYVIMNKEVWIQSFVWCELLFQLPFFFVATYGLLFEKNWIRIPSIFYGVHVATTVVPIVAETVFRDKNTLQEKAILCGFYLPYFIIPFALALYMAFNETPFSKGKSKKV
jgi:hypothetical protein